ncbi:hypothetical protein [Sphingobacterium bovistauri]|uniref:Uncharacterized protein n=1 Tax=Sphingobacterium bovistauri TaxID=2781959 RepID=A0ABS7Z7F4_9SPHI|nr:hypothetical protein [Sphingobacterium bovistauri]MCA5006121.1 hypothetical protein [Sphingobacterium bovistauri]
MKTIKSKLITGMATLALLFGLIFVVKAMQSEKTGKLKFITTQWFVFNGNPSDVDEIEDPNFYTPYSPTMSNPEPSCVNGTKLCAVKAEPDASNSTIPNQTSLQDVLNRNQGSSPDRSEIKHQP